jgi:hypothetical protein
MGSPHMITELEVKRGFAAGTAFLRLCANQFRP